MLAVTYLGRVSGYWFIRFVRPNAKTRAFLRLVPGTIFVAMIAPQLFADGWTGQLAAVLVFALAVRTGNMFVALSLGMLLFVALQSLV